MSEPHLFQLSTRETGSLRTVNFQVHSTREAMWEALEAADPETTWHGVLGGTLVAGWHTEDVPELVAEIYMNADDLDIGTIVHELAHAVLTMYRQDCTKWDSKARYHVRTENEMIPTLMGELMYEVAAELLAYGLYDDVMAKEVRNA